MLVLTRKPDQTVTIGDDVTIYFLRVSGNQMRIGIDAPADRTILRGELPRFDTVDGELVVEQA